MNYKTKEIKVANANDIYKVFKIINAVEIDTGKYRFRKHVKIDGRWSHPSATFKSLNEAREYAKGFTVEKYSRIQAQSESLKISEVFQKFIHHKKVERGLSKGSVQSYLNRYRHLQFFEVFHTSQITAQTVDCWINFLLEGNFESKNKSRKSFEYEYTLLSNVLNYYRNFLDEKYQVPLLDRHRLRIQKKENGRQKDKKFLSLDETTQFINQLSGDFKDLAILQLEAGLRIGEAAALDFRNVNFNLNTLTIASTVYWDRSNHGNIEINTTTKNKMTRIIPLTNACKEMLLNRRQNAKSSLVFDAGNGSPYKYRQIQYRYDKAMQQAFVNNSGTHCMRHTFAVEFLNETKNIYAAQVVLGHSDLKVTQGYAKYSNESVKKTFELYQGGKYLTIVPKNESVVSQSVS